VIRIITDWSSTKTPSPYRFLPPKASTTPPLSTTSRRKRKEDPPRYSYSHSANSLIAGAGGQSLPISASASTSATQFATVPRFNSSTPVPGAPPAPPAPPPPSSFSAVQNFGPNHSSPLTSRHAPIYKTTTFTPLRSGEAVEDAGPSPPSSPSLPHQDLAEDDVHAPDQDQGQDQYQFSSTDPDLEDLHTPLTPKRRRVCSPSLPPLPSSAAPIPPTTPTAPAPAAGSTTSRRRFILPPSPPAPAHREALAPFSPHKNGRKFVAGGLAATVRDWALEAAAEAGRGGGGGGGTEEEDDYAIVLNVDESTRGSGLVLIRGIQRPRNIDGVERVELCLALPEREDTPDLAGRVVGVRRPVWDLNLDPCGHVSGERQMVGNGLWKVGVDWQPL
jgi:hypothetical protein